MSALQPPGGNVPLPAMPPHGPRPSSSAARVLLREILVAAGVVTVVAVACYDSSLGLFLLVIGASAYLFHQFIVYLSDAGLLKFAVALVACLAIAVWAFLPDEVDLGAELRARTPASLRSALEPILARVLAGGDMVPAPPPSADARVPVVPTTAGAGAKSPAVNSAAAVSGTRREVAVYLTCSSRESARGDAVTFTVVVQRAKAAPRRTPERIELLDGGVRIAATALTAGQDGTRAMTFTVSTLAVGGHTLSARYRAGVGAAPAISATLAHTVRPRR